MGRDHRVEESLKNVKQSRVVSNKIQGLVCMVASGTQGGKTVLYFW